MMSVEINIPFPGFYDSWLSDLLDHELEHHAENETNESEYELQHPEQLRLDESEILDLTWRHCSFSDAHDILARAYLDAFDSFAGDILGETRPGWVKQWDSESREYVNRRVQLDSIGVQFSTMTSPREYNFETDRLFANVSFAFVKRLFAK